jgi:glycogen operon protein
MTQQDWEQGFAESVGVFPNGQALEYPDARGERAVDDSFLVLFNAHYEPISFTLPGPEWGQGWAKVIDTAKGGVLEGSETYGAEDKVTVQDRSLIALSRV